MKKYLITILAGLTVAGVALAEGVYGRVTGSSTAHGAATYTFAGDYAALLVKGITIKGAGVTNLATATRVTADGVHTQTMSAALSGAGTIQATVASPYLKVGDSVVFSLNSGNAAATSNFVYMIEYELQRR
jgi:hypothetical protein